MGLQFENLVYANLNLILDVLDINSSEILSVGPYFQKKTTKNEGSCQIDLLIVGKFDTAYLCEIKFRKKISLDVIEEIKHKIKVIEKPKYISMRPVLIYAGELSEELEATDFFYKQIDFCEFLG